VQCRGTADKELRDLVSLKEVVEARRVPKNVVKARVGLRLGREAFAYHHIIASTPPLQHVVPDRE